MTITITLIIIAITSIISIIALNNNDLYTKWLYNPFQVYHRQEWHRIFTHALLHGDVSHLFFNMYVLYMFGNNIESAFNYHFGNLGTVLYLSLCFKNSSNKYELMLDSEFLSKGNIALLQVVHY